MRIALPSSAVVLLAICASCASVPVVEQDDGVQVTDLAFDRCFSRTISLTETACNYEVQLNYREGWLAEDIRFEFSARGRLTSLMIVQKMRFAGATDWEDCFRRQVLEMACPTEMKGTFDRMLHFERQWGVPPQGQTI